MSNHLHILASPNDVEQMAIFMRHLGTNLSKEVGLLHDWRGPIFQRRYTSIPVSDEPSAQISRLKYLLAQGTKENLVLSPADWPGIHSVNTLTTGARLLGDWIDRSTLYNARKRGRLLTEADVTEEIELVLDPLPCWAHRTRGEHQARIRQLVESLDRETLKRHQRDGTTARGAAWVLRCHPHQQPPQEKRSPKPRFHAVLKAVRTSLVVAYQTFLVAYRIAAERLRRGDASVQFPQNCYPPRLPFVACTLLEPG